MIWRKVWRDLWGNKARTFLVILSTTVGVFALGVVFGLSSGMQTRMTESHQASQFPHIIFYSDRFDQDVADKIRHEPGVANTEGEDGISFRWKLEGETDWRDGLMLARDDYEKQSMNLVELLAGQWPADSRSSRTLAVERLSSAYFDIPLGTTIIVDYDHKERYLPVKGIIRHTQIYPPQLGGDAVFFATLETTSWLNNREEGYNRLNLLLETFSDEGAKEASKDIQDRLERMDVDVGYVEINDPEIHWMQDQIDSILLILTILGLLLIGLSGFLIVNVMNATIAQQVWQIGVMKTIGATTANVIRVYLAMASIYGLLALLIAIPLGAFAAHLLSQWLLNLLNIEVDSFRLMPGVILIQIVIGLVVPLLAALIPVIGGARITVHKAISTYGLGASFGASPLDRLFAQIRALPRPLTLSLRNTFRRKARIALTLITLVLGGLMFIVVISFQASLNNTLEVLLDDFGFDVAVGFKRLYRQERLVEVTEQVPGVVKAELWSFRAAELSLDEEEERQVFVRGVPADSVMFRPRIIRGRALLPEDDQAILLNNKIATDEGFKVGDQVTLTIEGLESDWTVVGLIINVNNNQSENFVPFDALGRATRTVNRGSSVWVMAEKNDAKSQDALIKDLRDTYANQHIEASNFESAARVREINQAQFDIITNLMLAMAILAAIVGSVGLMSTMSINVVERAREVGVIRAIGASSLAVLGIFVSEGVLVGIISWLLVVPFSYPLARLFSNLIGYSLLEVPLDFSYPMSAVLSWLVIMVVLSALASLWPALRATKVSVREALAYE